MHVFEFVVDVLGIILYILFLFVLSLGIWLAITGGIGLIGGVLSVPALYVLPDVRRFLIHASGGRLDDETPSWRVVLGPKYLGLSMAFGIVYGFAFLTLFIPFSQLGLFPGHGEPTSDRPPARRLSGVSLPVTRDTAPSTRCPRLRCSRRGFSS